MESNTASRFVKCAKCGKNIFRDVDQCPHCGKKDPTKQESEIVVSGAAIAWFVLLLIAAISTSLASDDKFGLFFLLSWAVIGGIGFQKRAGGFVAIGGGFIASLIIGGVAALIAAPAKPEDMAFTAYTNCESLVKSRLKAPSTADFAPFRKLAITGAGNGPWEVIGYVDAQNSFGAKIRSTYICKLSFSGGKVLLDQLSIN